MRLLDLEPRWLTFDGHRVGFIFRCPLLNAHPVRCWQTCFVQRFYHFKGRDGTYPSDEIAYAPDSQAGIVAASAPEAMGNWQGCNPEHQWAVAGGIETADFATISVTPSLDGSAGGNWHGFITNGKIIGGI